MKPHGTAAPSLVVNGLPLIPLLHPLAMDVWTGATVEAAKAAFLGGMVLLLLTAFAFRGPEGWSLALHRARSVGLPVGLSLAFGLTAILAAALALDPLYSLTGSAYWRGGLLTLLSQLVVFGLATVSISSGRSVAGISAAVTAGAVPTAAFALLQGLRLDPLVWDIQFPGRAFSTLGSPIILGNYLAMALPVGVAQVVSSRGGAPRRWLIAAVTIEGIALLSTLTRGAWLAAAAGLVMLAVASQSTRVLRRPTWLIVGSLGVIAAMALRPDPRTGLTRLTLWQDTLGLVADRPALGYGFESFARVFPAYQSAVLRSTVGEEILFDHAHNLWLDLAVDMGVLGPVLWSLIALMILRRGLCLARAERRQPERLIVAGFTASLASYLVQSLFMFPTIVPTTLYWLLGGVILSLRSIRPCPECASPGHGSG